MRTLRHSIVISTDASNRGAGILLENVDWAYVDWEIDTPQVYREHINIKESLAAIIAILRWAPLLQNRNVIILTDNVFTKSVLTRNVCRSHSLMPFLRQIFWLQNLYDFDITCHHIPGALNVYSDTLSRLRQRGHFMYWCSLLTNGRPITPTLFTSYALHHLSTKCASFFVSQFPRLIRWYHT